MALKRGNEVSTKGNVDLKEVTLRLKQDEKVKVILLSTQDYVQFPAHNDFTNKIYPQSCLLVDDNNTECPYCVASKNGFETLEAKNRMKFAFYDVTTGTVKFWEATNAQGTKLIKQIKGFADDIEYGQVFEFTRTGTGKDTSYDLVPIMERKYTDTDRQAIETAKEVSVSDEMFEEVCQPKSRKLVIQLLNEMGVPVTKLFSDAQAILDEADSESSGGSTDTASEDEIGF